MPQARSVAADDDDTIGPNSRYMSVVNQSLAHQRKAQVLQDLDSRMTRMKIQLMEKNALLQDMRYKTMQKRLRDNLERNLAYRMVVEEHNIRNSHDYHKAIDTNYSYDALKPEINKMMARLKPSYLREQKAKFQLQKSKEDQKMIIERNLEHPSLQTGEKKERRRRAAGMAGGQQQDYLTGMDNTVFVSSTGGVLLRRWADAFSHVSSNRRTPHMDGGQSPEEEGEGGGKEEEPEDPPHLDDQDGRQRLFTKVSRFGGGEERGKKGKLTPIDNSASSRFLHPLTETKSMKSLKSESSLANSYKTRSVGGTRLKKVKHVTMAETADAEHSDSGEEEESNKNPSISQRKKKKRYTLPPVRVQKRHIKPRAR